MGGSAVAHLDLNLQIGFARCDHLVEIGFQVSIEKMRHAWRQDTGLDDRDRAVGRFDDFAIDDSVYFDGRVQCGNLREVAADSST
jgi:hypothetical protein